MFFELTLATKRNTPCERVLKTVLENGIFSCVTFSFRSLGRFEKCEMYSVETLFFLATCLVIEISFIGIRPDVVPLLTPSETDFCFCSSLALPGRLMSRGSGEGAGVGDLLHAPLPLPLPWSDPPSPAWHSRVGPRRKRTTIESSKTRNSDHQPEKI